MTSYLSYDLPKSGFFKRLNCANEADPLTRATFGQPNQPRSGCSAPEPFFGEPRNTQLDSR
jgi:hypothetical protein